ncbi:MAG TPA: RyR domain-containing protein, partial [Reyranella sp.]|nr:RyR domain-containing protein [Reyranella sp.]
VVLIGSSEATLALARAYDTLGRRFIAIVPPVADEAVPPMEEAGARIVVNNGQWARPLHRAAVHRAAAVVALDEDDAATMALAGALAAANAHRAAGAPPLTFLVRLGHRELRALMGSQIASAMRQNRVDLKLYVRERTVARALVSRYPPDWGLPPGPFDIHAVIVGLGDMGAELLLQLARTAIPAARRRTIITVVDRDAEALRQQFLQDHPGLDHCAELRFISADVRASAVKAEDATAWLLAPLPATAIYVCCGNDHANLSMTLGLRRAYAHAGAQTVPIYVYQRSGPMLVEGLPQIHADIFDGLRVLPFGGLEQEADPVYLLDEEIDALARLVHEEYLRSRERMGGTPTPASQPWSELADVYRSANRSQADHMLAKLRGLGLHAVAGAPKAEIEIDAERLDALGRQEHERWCRDRWLAGWTLADKRDDARRRHTDLVPYDALSEAVRDLDRQTVRSLPALFGELGIGLKRDHRVGIWFATKAAASANARIADVAAQVASLLAGKADLHLQLVLPLRVPAEYALALALAKSNSVGVDVALIRGPAHPLDIGQTFDRQRARDLIAAADRAFVLAPQEAGEEAALASLRAVCDRVVMVDDDGRISG